MGMVAILLNSVEPSIEGCMWSLVKIDHVVSEKKFKDYMILSMYIAKGEGCITTRGRNFDCN